MDEYECARRYGPSDRSNLLRRDGDTAMSTRTVTTLIALSLAWSAPLFSAPPPGEQAAPRMKLPGKPTGPIAVEYRVAAVPAVGVPLEIDVSARVEAEVQGLSIEANASAPHAVL